MKIESGSAHSAIGLRDHKNTVEATKESGSNSFSNILAEQSQGSFESKGVSATLKEDEKLDFTNMTPSKLHETVGWLTQTGQMDLDESSALVGMMSSSSPLSRVNYDGLPFDYSDTPVDFFEKIQSSINGARSRNEQSSVEGLERAAIALSRFQGFTPPSVDVSV
ncbi:hypothetical protein [Pseudomonas sichuanensis]|uniref:hypothetical protein n=1 Tax=Pseudomonas sichuanensis TaxID=2213015 RepID=UPI0036E320A9